MSDKRVDRYYKKKAAERRTAKENEGEPEVKTLAAPPVDWQTAARMVALVAVVAIAAYALTLWGGYAYCDYFNLSPFRTVTKEWGDSMLNLLAQSFVSPLSQPLVRATYATDIAFGTISSPSVFHGDSLCLHLANCLLLFIVTLKIACLHNLRKQKSTIDPYVVATSAALIFACHPLASESVAYISARSALLVVFNYLFALLAFMRGFLAKVEQTKDALIGYGFSYFFLFFAVSAGSQGLTVAAAMVFLALMLKPSDETWDRWLTARPLEVLTISVVALIVPFVLLLPADAPIGNGFGLETLPPIAYIATQCKTLLTYYLRVMVVPIGQSLDPPMTMATGFTDPLAIVGALVPPAILYLAWRYRASLLVSFPLVLFVLALLPDFLRPQPEVMADRRMYLPLAAMCMPAGLVVAHLCQKRFVLTVATLAVVLLSFIGLTNWRDYLWQKDFRIWDNTYQLNKDSERSRVMRVWARSKEDILKAGEEARDELKQYPDSAVLNAVMGKYLNSSKKFVESKTYLTKALDRASKQNLSPEVVWDIQYGLAFANLQTDDLAKAKEYADKALEVQPNSSVLHLIRGEYFLSVDQPQAAVVELGKAHTLDRYTASVLVPLARAAIGCGTKEMQDLGYQAANLAQKVLNDRKLDLLRSYAALETGRVHEAVYYMGLFRNTEEPTAEMYFVLYGILKRLGAKQADVALALALKGDPDIRKKVRLYLNRPIILPKGTKETPEELGLKDTNLGGSFIIPSTLPGAKVSNKSVIAAPFHPDVKELNTKPFPFMQPDSVEKNAIPTK